MLISGGTKLSFTNTLSSSTLLFPDFIELRYEGAVGDVDVELNELSLCPSFAFIFMRCKSLSLSFKHNF